jgi:hypothetical protein
VVPLRAAAKFAGLFFWTRPFACGEKHISAQAKVATATRTQVAIIGGEFVGFPAIFVLQ